MPNQLSLSGAQSQKQTKWAPIFTSRFFSGLWTNRSPLRDATTNRVVEKFYGAAGDALISGQNTEVSNKLTLVRRPGTSSYSTNPYQSINRFYNFRLFNNNTEQIYLMVSDVNGLYKEYNGVSTEIFGTGGNPNAQIFMQSVGNTLYTGNGQFTQKWLQTLTVWAANTVWNPQVTPYYSTFLIDNHNYLQQLIGTFVTITAVALAGGVLTVTVPVDPTTSVSVGDYITFPASMTATFLENLTLEVTVVNTAYLQFAYVNPAYPSYSGSESNVIGLNLDGDGSATSGGTVPTWNTTVPAPANDFQGGYTYDGTAVWVNRGTPLEHWGIDISKGKQLAVPTTNLPAAISESVAGGSATVTQTGNGSSASSTVLSGFASQPVTGLVNVSFNIASIIATITSITSGGLFYQSGASVILNYSINSGSSWTNFYAQSWETASVNLYNIPQSISVAGLTNLNTLQIQISVTAYASFAGGSATITATLGDVIATANPPYTFWAPNTMYGTGQIIVDSNGNLQTANSTGTSQYVAPTWSTTLGGTTNDGSLSWTLTYLQAISALNGGYEYGVALVNTLDNTVSNCTKLSPATGNFVGAEYVQIPAGAGLPPKAQIDPQSDFVAIFRTTDGQATPFLIPGPGDLVYTVPLSEYLANGYQDHTPDTGLNNLIEGAILGENTPPMSNSINLEFHLNRIFYSVGNTVYWTSGPDTPVGNGVNGSSPLNYSGVPSLVKRLVSTSNGLLVFTVSDVYLIPGNGTADSPIGQAVPLLPGIGLLSYNALDNNGPTIGLFTTDNQFIILDPSSGTTRAGFPIEDQLQLNNGNAGQSWNPANVYVAYHVQGQDAAWYVCDGVNGWYRLIPTPAPEVGYTWCPFATIIALNSGPQCVQSIEISPGVHRLLLGFSGVDDIGFRDLTVWTDLGTSYPANATIGSIVLAQPGQVAVASFITTQCVKIGTPLNLGILIDEALPYYTGPIEILNHWVTDPPNLPASKSFWKQRFYFSELPDESQAMMLSCQAQIIWSPGDTVQNELLAFTIFGGFFQET